MTLQSSTYCECPDSFEAELAEWVCPKHGKVDNR